MSPEQVEVLYIEDNPHEAELAIVNLKEHNLADNLLHIADGADALDYIFSRGEYEANKEIHFNPKVIIMDLKLPRVSGFEILKELKADPQKKNIPVVILSSSNEERDVKECYRLGANSYILKPVAFDQYVRTIAAIGNYWIHTNTRLAAN